jgi:hypothetical protein
VKTKPKEDKPKDWKGRAKFSRCRKYRYVLVRDFHSWKIDATCVFVMLNPSTATADVSDPTVTRCEGYARQWGYRRLIVLNVFAYRATDPDELYEQADPVGPLNDRWIARIVRKAAVLVCAWGVHALHMDRHQRVLKLVAGCKPCYLKLTKGGIPGHPLYLKQTLKPQPMVIS